MTHVLLHALAACSCCMLTLLLQASGTQANMARRAGPRELGAVNVTIDWSRERLRTSTAATVEVDVMPFLSSRTSHGGPFQAYYRSLVDLDAEYVRFAPWTPNPRVTVPELMPPDCTSSKPATNWNSTLLDEVMASFFGAVCGDGAAQGSCRRSVIMQVSTMPSWMYVGGMHLSDVPADPWVPTRGHKDYAQGSALIDPTCEQMARHVGRVVGWYTAGGFRDECGHWHESGLRYHWWGLSILNEDEHRIAPDNGTAYVTCFDAIVRSIARVAPSLVPAGPEISGSGSYPSPEFDYLAHFLQPRNHANGAPPPLATWHWQPADHITNDRAADVFGAWDATLLGFVARLSDFNGELGGGTALALNEFIPSVADWCDCTGVEHLCPWWRLLRKCPSWENPATAGGDSDLTHQKGVRINRRTLSWSAAAAVFAYAFGTLAERGYILVAQDQLVAGTWPDNEPAVAMLDWQTGEPNAKFWATQLLARTVGQAREKMVVHATVAGKGAEALYALPYVLDGSRAVLLINKAAAPLDIVLGGVCGGLATVVEAGGVSPGFQPPLTRNLSNIGGIRLGPFAVAVVHEYSRCTIEGSTT